MKTTKEIITGNWKPKQLNQKWCSERELREIIRAVIWRIAEDEGGQILHYNDWVDDNWKELLNAPTIDGEQINKTGGRPNDKQ